MAVADLEPGDVDAQSAGFRLGPRINAAGRLLRADAALELMLTEDPERATEIARELDGLNHDRRETEQRILHEAEALCAPQLHAGALVVAGQDWHAGVVGIVASRLVERFRRPAVVIALDGDSGRGSGRSIAAYDLHAGLGAAAEHLIGFGGHRMAAGLEIEAGRVDAFRAALAAHAGAALAPADLTPVERVDAVISGGVLTLDTAEELARLGPFGPGNPKPRLLVPAAGIEHVTAMGEERKHARFSLVGGGARARGVAFRRSQRSLAAAGACPQDVVVDLERNRWNGAVEARVVLRSLSPTRAGQVREVGERELWDGVARRAGGRPGAVVAAGAGRAAPGRTVRERHGEGLAGLAGDLLTSGEPVLVVVADVARRRAGLERTIAGMAPGRAWPWPPGSRWRTRPRAGPSPTRTCWPWTRPRCRRAIDAAGRRPGHGFADLAWGPAETEFTLAYWRHRWTSAARLAVLWRALSAHGGLDGPELDAALRGPGTHPRGGRAGRPDAAGAGRGGPGRGRRRRPARCWWSLPADVLDVSPAFRAYGSGWVLWSSIWRSPRSGPRSAPSSRIGTGCRTVCARSWPAIPVNVLILRSSSGPGNVELVRDNIVRKDFKQGVRGYDTWEVDAHLRALNHAVGHLLDQLVTGRETLPKEVSRSRQTHVTIAQLEAAEIIETAEAEAKEWAARADVAVKFAIEEGTEEADRLVSAALAEVERMLAEGRAAATRRRATSSGLKRKQEGQAKGREDAEQLHRFGTFRGGDHHGVRATKQGEQVLEQAQSNAQGIRTEALALAERTQDRGRCRGRGRATQCRRRDP